jgi:hypothetical protein
MEIVQGSREGLVIEAEENLLPHLIAEVKGDELIISVERGYALQPTKDIKYQLSVKELQAFSLSGAGDIKMDHLETGDFTLLSSGAGNFTFGDVQADSVDFRISGAGKATAAGKANELKIDISGAGSFDGADLQVQDAQVSISGLGSATVWAEDTLETDISGAGSVNYYGDPRLDKTSSGAGIVERLGDK